MAYTPTEWMCGDVVTADALNKIEQGIAGASGYEEFPVIFTFGDGNVVTADKTLDEIIDAYQQGKKIVGYEYYGNIVTVYYMTYICPQSEPTYATFVSLPSNSVRKIEMYRSAGIETISYTSASLTWI